MSVPSIVGRMANGASSRNRKNMGSVTHLTFRSMEERYSLCRSKEEKAGAAEAGRAGRYREKRDREGENVLI
jgi:hypothetical protein